MATQPQTRSLTATSQFTDAVIFHSYFNVSISGTWTGTITIQRSFDSGNTWVDIKNYTFNIEEYGFEPERFIYYRIGVKSTSTITGTAVVRLGQ